MSASLLRRHSRTKTPVLSPAADSPSAACPPHQSSPSSPQQPFLFRCPSPAVQSLDRRPRLPPPPSRSLLSPN
ncbi:unnamed protein product [Linum trigynum]|uniref:Uncharacterized protein n=1 Tax=Linum trigynum TaxID=586398 RepID=A0AAV2ENM1_9ROSI